MVLNNDIEIEIINPGETDPIVIEPDSWSLKRYRDAHRASELNFKCSRGVPIKKFAAINALDGGSIRFLGYAKTSTISWPSRREITCKGREELLWHRYTHRWSYIDKGYHFYHPFQSSAPTQVADEYDVIGNVGLLFIANSRIPSYMPFGLGSFIYRYDGWGTNSVVGTKEIYQGGELLPRVDGPYWLFEATDIGSWADENDLFVRNATHYFGLGGFQTAMDAANAFDTGVRAGTIDDGDQEIEGNVQLHFDRIGDFLVNFAEVYGKTPMWRYGQDRLCYLDVLEGPAQAEFDLEEGDIDDFKQSNANEPMCHALIGLGVGSKDCQGIYAKANPVYKGIWYQDIYAVPDNRGWVDARINEAGTGGEYYGPIYGIVDAEYAKRLEDDIYEITVRSWPHRPKPWDRINLKLIGEADAALSVASVKTDSNRKQVLELGGRRSEIMDAFNAKSSLANSYLYEYLEEAKRAITASGTMTIGDLTQGWCTGFSFSVTIPADVEQEDGSHRVTLDLTMDASVMPGVADLLVYVGGSVFRFGEMPHYLLNDAISMMDITTMVNYGSATDIVVYASLRAEWADSSSCTTHPTANMSATVRMWKRIPLT